MQSEYSLSIAETAIEAGISANGMLSGRQKLPADLFFEICRELNVDPMVFVPEKLKQ